TLDSVIQGPGGPEEDVSGDFEYGGWIVPYSDKTTSEVMEQQMSRQFNLLLGRRTYEIWARYWPDHEEVWPGINAVTKYVASHDAALQAAWNNSVLLTGDVANEVAKLKEQDGPELHVYGSANLVQTLLKHDLVDELWLKIFPITLGTGKRLFVDGTIPAAFRLTDSRITPKGVIIVNYERAGAVETGSF
ncbi:MAG TPA: dihydrofolate reductase, partial [Firmicutes bacterium]|nr:dihydrofolate reductase [Bacillota bacterium]